MYAELKHDDKTYETVIITSVNEGILPGGKTNNSFIPYDVKIENAMAVIEIKIFFRNASDWDRQNFEEKLEDTHSSGVIETGYNMDAKKKKTKNFKQ